jgi:hypothetical protein
MSGKAIYFAGLTANSLNVMGYDALKNKSGVVGANFRMGDYLQYGSVKQIFFLMLVRVGGLCITSGDFSRWLTEPDWDYLGIQESVELKNTPARGIDRFCLSTIIDRY